MCDEIINAADSGSRNGSANVTCTVLTNFHRKVRYKMDYYILHTVLLGIILLFIIVKTKKHIVLLNNIFLNLKKFILKIQRAIILMI